MPLAIPYWQGLADFLRRSVTGIVAVIINYTSGSPNSLKVCYEGEYRGLLLGFLRGILGV